MLIAFDYDGTLLDTFPSFLRMAALHCQENSLTLPAEDVLRHGFGNPINFDYGWPGSLEEQNKIRWQIYHRVDALDLSPTTQLPLFDGVPALLRDLRQHGHQLALITSKPDEPAHRSLNNHGLKDLFDIIIADDTRRNLKLRSKPEPDMLQHTHQHLGHTAENTIMIGDTTMDILMGCRAGCTALGAGWGVHNNDVLTAAGAKRIFENIAELQDHLLQQQVRA
jgi:phosphoglycolate phosphatase